jgi:hypothetical protein
MKCKSEWQSPATLVRMDQNLARSGLLQVDVLDRE